MATVMATVLATLSVLAMYAEVLLVIYVAAEHGISESSKRLTFALVLALLLVALVLTNIASAVLALTSSEWSSWGGRGGVAIFVVLHVLQMGVVWRAAKVHLAYERRAWLQLSTLRLLHAGVLSLPFLLVQGRDTLSRTPAQPLHVVSLVVSVLSASLALVSFTVRKQVQDSESSKDATAVLISKAPWRKVLGVVLLLFGTSLALASRAGSFVLLSLAKNWWVLLPIGLHFVIVAASAVASKACEHQCTKTVVLKEICVSYINIYEMIDASDFKRVRCKYVTFYTLVVVENIVMTAVWLLTSPQDYVTKLVVVVSLLAAFVFALVAKFASCGLIADPSEEPDLVLSDISDVLSVLEHAQQKSKQRLSSSVATVSTHVADRGRGDTSSSAIFENQTTDTFLSLDASSGSALSQQRLQGRSSRGGKDREGKRERKREGKKEELGGELVEEEEGEEERSHTDYSTFRSDATMEMFSIDDPTTCSNLIRSKRATKSKPKPHAQTDEGGKTQRSAAARRRRGKGEGATLSSRKSKKLAKIDPIALKEKYFKVYNRSKQKELESAVGRRATDSGSSKRGHSDRGRSCDSLTRTLEEVGRISRMPIGRDFDGDTSLTEDLTSSTRPQGGVETFVEPLPSEDGFPLRSVSQRAVKKAQCREEVLDFRSGLATCRMNQGRRDKKVPREKRLKTSNVDIELRALRTQPLNGHPPYLKHPASGAGGSNDKVRPYSMCIGEKFDLDPPIIGYVCESPRVRSGAGEKNDKCLCNHGNNNPWSSLGPKMRRSKERVKDAAAGISSTFRRVSNELRKSQSSTNSHSVSTVVCRRPKPKPRAKASSQSKDQRASFPRWVKPRDRPQNSAARMRNSHPVGFDWDASVSSDTTADVTHVTATGSCSGSSTGDDDFSSELSSFMTWSWSHKGVILRPEALAPRQICGASEERIKRWLETVSPALACPLEDERGGSSDDVIKSSDDLHGPSVGSDVNSLSVLSSLPSSARSKDSVMAEVGIPKGKHSAGRFVGGVGARPKYERSDRPLFLVATTSPRMGGTTEVKSIHLDVEGKKARTGNGRKQDSTSFIISDTKQRKRNDMVCDIQLPIDTMESLV